MTEQEFSELEPLYEQAKTEVPALGKRFLLSAVQRQYRIGYNRAARLLEALAAAGVLEFNNLDGSWRPAQRRGAGQ